MVKPKKANLVQNKNVALEKQLVQGKITKRKNKDKFHLRAEESSMLDSKTSKKILDAAKAQQLELNDDNFPSLGGEKAYTHVNIGEIAEEDENKDVTENDFMDNLEIDAEDAKAFERFQNPQEGKRTLKLSDIILEKIQEKQQDIQSKLTDNGSLNIEDIDPRVREMYEGVRDVMKRYRSGKVPKAFKIIPRLRNWEQILFITEPHNWSAAAMFQGTRQ
uniref:Bystin n=1 Tax=Bactrocera latifrons TaxID=174628 RepID=A0A0K8VTG8_BACLA